MAALDFPNSPTVGQTYTPASGAKYTWDGQAWTLGGPITAGGAAGGDLSGTYPAPTVVKASGTFSTGGATTVGGLLTLTASGDPIIAMGSGAIKGGITTDANGQITMQANHPWAPQDASKSSWLLSLQPNGDQVILYRRAPAAATGSVTTPIIVRGSDGKMICSLDNNSVTRAMLGTWVVPGAAVSIPVSFVINGTANPYNTWIKVVDFPPLTTKGNRVFLSAGPCLLYQCLSTTATAVGQLFRRSGTDVNGSGAWVNFGTAGIIPLPTHQAQDGPPAGTYTYSYWAYLASGTSAALAVHGNGAAWCWATESP